MRFRNGNIKPLNKVEQIVGIFANIFEKILASLRSLGILKCKHIWKNIGFSKISRDPKIELRGSGAGQIIKGRQVAFFVYFRNNFANFKTPLIMSFPSLKLRDIGWDQGCFREPEIKSHNLREGVFWDVEIKFNLGRLYARVNWFNMNMKNCNSLLEVKPPMLNSA